MAYSEFKTISTVLKEFQVRYHETNFVEPLPIPISDYFREDLDLIMREGCDHRLKLTSQN